MAKNKHMVTARWTQGGDLLPHIVDRVAAEHDLVYARWPRHGASNDSGAECVTYSSFANIINGLSWWLVDSLGKPKHTGQVIAYIGPNDVRLTALLIAAIKTGWVLFLTSPRNSAEAHKALFESLDCQFLATTQPQPPAVADVVKSVNVNLRTLPSIEDLISKEHAVFAYTKSFEQGRNDPLWVIHTSGSTGIPKPLIWTNETASRTIEAAASEPPDGFDTTDNFWRGKSVMSTLPSFHGAGLCQYLYTAMPFGGRIVSPPTRGIMTAQDLVDALELTSAEIAILVPSIVAELSWQPDLLDACAKHLKMIFYIGGDLPEAMGNIIADKIRLQCLWGTSEVGIPPQLLADDLSGRGGWHYIRFHPRVGAKFDKVADNTYELVIRRNEKLISWQPSFTIRGQEDLDEYRTKDLFEPHPTVPDAWSWRARRDDIIVFLNGEKTNPVTMEQQIVAQNRELSGAIVIGAQRFQAALALEPASTEERTTADDADLVERIWPSIEEANRSTPSHARIDKSLVFVVPPHRRFIRAGKGTIQKAASMKLLSHEIDEVYTTLEAVLDHEVSEITLQTKDRCEVSRYIQQLAMSLTGWSDLDETDDFFERGMDSLQALQVLRSLRRVLHDPSLALSTIYQHATAAKLASAIALQSLAIQDTDADLIGPLLETHSEMIEQIRAFHTSTAPTSIIPSPDSSESHDVLLTGSTGSLGSFLLHALLRRPSIGHVFCLNRGKDGGRAAQLESFTKSGLSVELLDSGRVTFLKARLTNPSLGLDGAAYTTLQSRVRTIIHNAWPVNFNLGLSAFRPQFVGMVNLFALADSLAAVNKRFVFISSVSAISRQLATESVPEAVLESATAADPIGYARSKFIAEHLCVAAAKSLDLPVQVLRVGQVAGAVNHRGVWNPTEWLPSLIISSVHLGSLPDALGPQFSNVDWVPADFVADTAVDIIETATGAPTRVTGGKIDVLNIRNPIITPWSNLLPVIVDQLYLCIKKKLNIVSSEKWLALLQESASDAEPGTSERAQTSASLNPAIKLADVYQVMLRSKSSSENYQAMSIDGALAVSPTLKEVPAVGQEWMRKWVREWVAE